MSQAFPAPAPLSDAEQRLMSAVKARHNAMLADLEDLVNTPTGRAPHPAALEGLQRTRDTMRRRLEALGATAQLIPGDPRPPWLDGPSFFRAGPHAGSPTPPTLICRRPAPPGRAPILLSGHLDTVHDPSPQAPFRTLTIAADRKTATGPGVVDMKGGLTIALHALEALAEVGLDAPFGFILNSDEETGSFHSDRALRAEAANPTYAAALALEPANGPTGLVTARGGSGQCMIEARGRSAHVGRDFASGRSATDLLARAILAAHALTDISAGGGGTIANVSTLWCDQPPNQVADHAAAWGNLRYLTQESGEGLAQNLKQALANLSPTDLTLHISLIRPAKPSTPATMALAETVQAAAALLGQQITFTTTAGVCDGNNLQAARESQGQSANGKRQTVQTLDTSPVAESRLPIALPLPPLPVLDTLGVRGGGLHTTEEWIDLSSLVERAQLLALLIHRHTAGVTRAAPPP